MLYKKLLFEQGYLVEDLLNEYVNIHNLLLHKSGTLQSFIKNLFFKKRIDFKYIFKLAQDVDTKISDKVVDLNEIKNNEYILFNYIEKQYFNTLTEYVDALKTTTQRFVEFTELLYLGSLSKANLSWAKYKDKENLYNIAINEYQTVGIKLMNQHNKLAEDLNQDNVIVNGNFTVDDIMKMDLEIAKKYQRTISGEKVKRINNEKKQVEILGEKIDKKNFPILYGWAKRNPETLKTTLKSLANQPGGSITNAIICLESDLQHG